MVIVLNTIGAMSVNCKVIDSAMIESVILG